MKRFLFKSLKILSISIISILVVSVGIDAADHFGNFSDSILGTIIKGKSSGPCPDDMTFVSTDKGGYCIDRFEASAGAGCDIKNPQSQPETAENLNNADCKPASVNGAIPWTNISQTQAVIACAKAGKHLASDLEWYQAALGTPDPPSDWGQDDCQVSKNWPNQPGLTGSGKNCVSPMGAYDMIGNVWEWVKAESVDGKINNRQMPPSGYINEVDINGLPLSTDVSISDDNHYKDYFWIKEKDVRGMARGGYWDNASDAGQFSVYLVPPPSYVGLGVGFRCAK
jgi:formylglycine-generating enzyme required for sulfatase activity